MNDTADPQPSTGTPTGVSVVIPVCGGDTFLGDTIPAALAQDDGRTPFEIILVDDEPAGRGGHLTTWVDNPRVRIVEGPRRGAAAAINAGLRAAAHPLIAQVDQDVRLHPGWLRELTTALSDDQAAAAQGWYETAADASIWAWVAGLDLEDRYQRIGSTQVDHVCTGNSVYRASALESVGRFAEDLGYGYDNDMSYRLTDAGFRLVLVPSARSTHAWRTSLAGYLRQQYGQGYGRLDLVARHPGRVGGDAVSGLGMILHAPGMLFALICLGTSLAGAVASVAWWPVPAMGAAVVLTAIAAERTVAALRMARRGAGLRALAVVPAHLLRNTAWAVAIVTWTIRRLFRRRPVPRHSMTARSDHRP
jgi:hypothetical protein